MPIFDAHAYLTHTPFSETMATGASVLETMRRYDITSTALISGLAADCDFVTGNRLLREVINPEQGLFGYVTLNADYSEESLQEQRKYLARRGWVAGVLFGHDDCLVTLDDAQDILNAQRRYAKPMAIHVPNGDAVHAAREIAAQFPTMKFIFLSMGGESWHTAVAAAKQHLNIYLEISGSLDSDKVSHAVATLTARKLLYGSRLPYASPELTLGLVQTADALTRPDRDRILSLNAQALLNVESESETAE